MTKRTKKKAARKRAPAKKKRPSVYVSAAWISTEMEVHPSSVEHAWRRGDLLPAFEVLGGNGRSRPIFLRTEAERWHKGKAA